METFQILLQRMIVLVLIGVLGFFAQKRKILNEQAQFHAREIMIKLGVPFAILSSVPIETNPVMRGNISLMLLIAFLSLLLFFLIAQLVIRTNKVSLSERAAITMSLMFGNTMFVGLPLAEAAFGSEGIFYLALFNLAGALLTWSYGVRVCNPHSKFDVKKILFNPACVASFAMILLVCFNLSLPAFLHDTFSILGRLSTPLSMLLIGAMLAGTPFREVFRQRLGYLITLLRLVILPIAIGLLLRLFHVSDLLLRVSMVCVALPAGSLNPSVVRSGGLDASASNNMTVLTTIFSIITIPLTMLYVDLLLLLPI